MSVSDVGGAANQKKTASGKERTWTKNHPLEGDGLLVNFYNHMWKKNKDFQSCPGGVPQLRIRLSNVLKNHHMLAPPGETGPCTLSPNISALPRQQRV